MRVMNISEKKFDSLKPLELPNDILNTESELYIIEDKNKWAKRQSVLKKLYINSGTVFSNKLYTVNELIDNKDKINIDELVMPEYIVTIYGKIVGFTVPYVDNINFKHVLDSVEFTNSQKIDFFKQVGQILHKMSNVREYTSVKDFYLNDLHENNLIFNKKTGKINVVDLDSCKIGDNFPFVSKYLSPISPINEVNKYRKLNIDYIGGSFIPDENTDLFCYTVMILNYLYGGRITSLSISEYYDYLTYLHSIGVSHELVDKFSLIYTEKNNENIYEYLDELVNVIGRSNQHVYEYVKKKQKK